MKTGLSLTEMAAELSRRQATKKDYIADTRQLSISVPEVGKAAPSLVLDIPGRNAISLAEGPVFQQQVAGHYKIPRDYLGRIRTDHPQLYARTLNTFFREEPARRMLRTLDNAGRAFLSDRYRTLDDFDLAEAVLPELLALPQLRVESTAFTDSRFYIKAVLPRVEMEVKKGDVVQIGIVISNSEVGAGALQVLPLVYRLWCLNGAIAQDYGVRKYHVGKRAAEEESAYELYSDRTRALDDKAFFAKVKDTVKGVLTREVLEKLVAKMRDATEQPIESKDLPAVVELTAKKFGYNETTKQGILTQLIQGGDLTRYGLMNAITRQSQDETDYETATRLEADGGRVIELPKSEWTELAKAA